MIEISRPWTRQPQVPVSTKDTRSYAYNFRVTRSIGARGQNVTLTAAGSFDGLGLKGSGTDSAGYLGSTSGTEFDPRTGDFAIVFQFKLTTIPGSAVNQYIVATDAGFDAVNHWRFFARGDGSSYTIRGIGNIAGGSYIFKANEVVTVAVTRKNGVVDFLSTGPSGSDYFSGVSDTSDYYNRTTSPIRFLGSQSNGLVAAGEFVFFGINPKSSEGYSARELARNPWQLFAPQTSRIWVPPAAAGGVPTLSALSAINVTSSSAQPRITYTF